MSQIKKKSSGCVFTGDTWEMHEYSQHSVVFKRRDLKVRSVGFRNVLISV